MKPLIINHKIYGKHKITEPVLLELIKSPALQRLKEIGQLGAWDFHHTAFKPFSRYQHSIGVMLLLRKFNASLNEQIVGLLHDVSHTAFSHVADRLFGSYIAQDYQDKKLIQAFDIQGVNKILKKHNIKPSSILDEKKFTLSEKELPDLCADRLDYTFQDPVGQKLFKTNPKEFLKNLTVHQNQFVFTNYTWAKKFGLLYTKIDQKLWYTPLQCGLYQILADAIKIGLDKKIITKKDLFTTDKLLTKKLIKSKNVDIIKKIKSLKNLKVKEVPKNKADLFLKSKTRIIDPYFLKNNKLVRLSKADPKYKKIIDSWAQIGKKGFWVKIITQSESTNTSE